MMVQDEEVTLVTSKEVMKEVKHNINPKKLRDSGAVET
jgi:predicted nucleic acid-binding protein